MIALYKRLPHALGLFIKLMHYSSTEIAKTVAVHRRFPRYVLD